MTGLQLARGPCPKRNKAKGWYGLPADLSRSSGGFQCTRTGSPEKACAGPWHSAKQKEI